MKLNSQSIQCWRVKFKKKTHKATWVNRLNSWPESWDLDNLIEFKPKQIIKLNFQLASYWRMKFKEIQLKKGKKKPESISNQPN
jgi:hypothetical protein